MTPDPLYRIGAEDVLKIEVFNEPTLTGDFTVDASGRIVFPLAGEIGVAGSTVEAVQEDLRTRLEKDYLKRAQVSVSVKEFKSRKVKILGNVGKPGIYFLEGPLRLFDLLSRAEGVAPRLGDIRRGQTVRIVRLREADPASGADPESDVDRFQVDLYELLVLGSDEANVHVNDGDVIYVPSGESIHVLGEVKQPGTFPYDSGMTVFKAISLAGGATKKGSTRGTVIKRIQDGKEIRLRARMEDLLEPDDVVEVPLSFW